MSNRSAKADPTKKIMNREQLEFSISQYLDGTLPGEQRSLLEQRFEADAEARELLAKYRSLNDVLRIELPVPEMHWERLAERLSASVADVDLSAPSYRIGPRFTMASLAIAASVLLAIGMAFVIFRQGRSSSPQPTAIVQVEGPRLEPTTAPAIAEISIGPADTLAKNKYQLSEPMNESPSHAIFIAPAGENSDDTHRAPY